MRYSSLLHKYKAAVCALMILVMCGLCGCAGERSGQIFLYAPEEQDTAGDTRLAFFGYKSDSLNLIAIEAALRGFMEENDITVVYEGMKGTDYWNALEKRADSNTLDDIFMVDREWVQKLGSQGRLADLSGLSGIENYMSFARGQFTGEDGAVWFILLRLSTYNLYVNYDLLEEYDLEVPKDWKAFSEVCDFFVSKGIVPVVANNFNSVQSLIVARSLMDVYQQEDSFSAIQNFNEHPEILASELTEGIVMAEEMLARGWMDAEEVLVTEQTSDDLALFVKGDRPFMITGGWASVRVAAMNPELSYGIYPYPIFEDGAVLSMDVATCIAINRESGNMKEAEALAEHLILPDILWNYCESQSSYSPLNDSRKPSDEALVPSVEYLSNGRSVIGSDYRFTIPVDNALNQCIQTLLSGGSAEEAEEALKSALCEG